MNRSSSFLAILLILSLVLIFNSVNGSPLYEDFNDGEWTEIDPDNKITVTTNEISHLDVNRSDSCYVYKDFGVDFFNGNFTHTLDIYCNYTDTASYINIWALMNGIGDRNDAQGSPINYCSVYFRHVTNIHFALTVFATNDTGDTYQENSASLNKEQWYYLTIQRVYQTLYCLVYTDASRTSLLYNLTTGDVGCIQSYRYLYATQSFTGSGDWLTTGHIRNLDLNLPIPPRYVTFKFNEGGILRVDNVTVTNGSMTEYVNGTIIELASLPKNASYIFLNVTWTNGNSTFNPFNYTVTSNMTIWAFFGDKPSFGGGFILGAVLGLCIIIIVVLAYSKK